MKTFVEGETVEIVPDPVGRAQRYAHESDWEKATYDEPIIGTRDWHWVTCKSRRLSVPGRRIRKAQ